MSAGSESEARLDVVGVTKTFGGVTAVSAASLSLAAGTIHGLIGPNGAGKSTMIGVVTGFIKGFSGQVRFAGRDIAALDPTADRAARLVAHLPAGDAHRRADGARERHGGHAHAPPQPASLGVLFRTPAMRREAKAVTSATRALLEEFGLAADADADAADLPFGKLRFLEIARAVVMRPQILLLDEPAAGLNQVETERLAAVIRRQVGLGVGILLVDHDVPFVFELCDQVTVMNFGSVIASGRPDLVCPRPEPCARPISARRNRRRPCDDPHPHHRPRHRLRLRLIAVGYSLEYRTTGVVNFSEGNYVMVGGFSTYWFLTVAGLPYPLAILAGIAVTTLCGLVLWYVHRAAAVAPAQSALCRAARHHRLRRHPQHPRPAAARPDAADAAALDSRLLARLRRQPDRRPVHRRRRDDAHHHGAHRPDAAVHLARARDAGLRREPRHQRASRHLAGAHGLHLVRRHRRSRRSRRRDDHAGAVHFVGCRASPTASSASSPQCSAASGRCRARSSAGSCSALVNVARRTLHLVELPGRDRLRDAARAACRPAAGDHGQELGRGRDMTDTARRTRRGQGRSDHRRSPQPGPEPRQAPGARRGRASSSRTSPTTSARPRLPR